MESGEIGRVCKNITKALQLIATRRNLSVVPSLKMTKDIYPRAIDNVSVSKIILIEKIRYTNFRFYEVCKVLPSINFAISNC